MNKRVMSLVLSAAVLSSSLLPSAYAADDATFPDMPNDWSTAALQNAVKNGLLNGIDGKIAASENLTRAQMAAIVTRAFGTNGMASLSSFSDVKSGDWFYDAMASAVNMGAFKGDGNMLNPNAAITRQEAFTVLARLFTLSGADVKTLDSYTDGSKVATWAQDAMASMVKAGYVTGANNQLNPTSNITRAEFAKVMDNLLKDYLGTDAKGTNSTGNAVLNKAGVLEDVKIAGDLILGDGIAEGDVTLKNVTVEGRLVVRGGGVNTVKLEGTSTVKNGAVVNKPTGEVRLNNTTTNKLSVDIVSEQSTLTGNFEKVNVTGEGANVSATDAKIAEANVNGGNAVLATAGNTTIATANLNAAGSGLQLTGNSTVTTTNVAINADNAAVNVGKGSTLKSLTSKADGVNIAGEGKLENAKVEGNNTAVNTVGTNVNVASGVTGTTSNGNNVSGGSNVTTKPEGEKPGTGTGSGSGSTGGDWGTTYKYNVVMNYNSVGGQVNADVTGSNVAGTVTVKVAPNQQNGSIMPYVVKSATLKNPGDTVGTDVLNQAKAGTITFSTENDKTGNYVLDIVFEQPITQAETFVIDSVAKLQSLVDKEYVTLAELVENIGDPAEADLDAKLKAHPWLAVAVKRANGATETITPSHITFYRNGKVLEPTFKDDAAFGKVFTAYIDESGTDGDEDELNSTVNYGDFNVEFSYGSTSTSVKADYNLNYGYYPDGQTYKTVTFKVDGSTFKTVKLAGSDVLNVPVEVPTKVGYTFAGWYNDTTKLVDGVALAEAKTEYTAKWDVNKYSIAFNANGGTGTISDISNVEYGKDQILTKNTTITRRGYRFTGWNTRADGAGIFYADGATVKNLKTENNGVPVILYAQWAESIELSLAPVEKMSAEIYQVYKNATETFGKGAPANVTDFGTLTYTQSGNTFNATGTAKYVAGYTGFNQTVVAEQYGYYGLFQFKAPADVVTDNTTVIVKAKGSSATSEEKPFTSTALDAVASGDKYFSMIVYLGDDASAFGKSFKLKVDWDGADGNVYKETEYTINFSGVTADQASKTAAFEKIATAFAENIATPVGMSKDVTASVANGVTTYNIKLGVEEGKTVATGGIMDGVDNFDTTFTTVSFGESANNYAAINLQQLFGAADAGYTLHQKNGALALYEKNIEANLTVDKTDANNSFKVKHYIKANADANNAEYGVLLQKGKNVTITMYDGNQVDTSGAKHALKSGAKATTIINIDTTGLDITAKTVTPPVNP